MVSRSRHFQRGDFLVEAIIGLALMAVVGIGVIHMNGRISASKHETSIQDLAITQMRDLLQKIDTPLPSLMKILRQHR